MGFSVSGAAAIIFASMFVAFGMWFSANSNSFHRLTEAREIQTDHQIETKNTVIEITSATYNESGNQKLRVDVDNNGATDLSLNGTSLLVDGTIVTGWQGPDADVDGNTNTDLWFSGEELTVVRDPSSAPDRVKIVTESGVADTEPVEVFL